MMEPCQYSLKYQQLLRDLKSTVEGLLVTQVANVWSIYGGLNRLHNAVEKIFAHGCKTTDNGQDFFNFIQGLEWLQPETSKSYFSIDCEYRPHIPSHLKGNKSSIWLYRSLENHSLSQKLSWLLSDKSHVSTCYSSYAFLCQDKYTEATLICLRAVERNQPSLMSEINPCLFLFKTNAKECYKVHRRCFSFPDNHFKTIYEEKIRKCNRRLQENVALNAVPKELNVQGKLKPWRSLPCLQFDSLKIRERFDARYSKTTPSTPVNVKKLSPAAIKVDYDSLGKKNWKVCPTQCDASIPREVKCVLINNKGIVEHTPPSSSWQSIRNDTTDARSKKHPNLSHSPLSVMDSFLALPGEKDYRRKPKSFIEDGGSSVLPMATGYFPKPVKGQSLLSFLTSSHFARTNAELDRENAHFNISEAIISAMEQIRCKRELKLFDEQLEDSDPEIVDLKQRIRLRRRQKEVEKQRRVWAATVLSDGKTDTTTSVSPCSTSSDSMSDCISSDDVENLEIDQSTNLQESTGLSMSMASLYSESDVMKRPRGAPDGASDILSAEGVAISLISKFSEKQLPRASDLEWLVSETDAPQALLPLPKSWPVSPDDSDEATTPLRGTQEWAPPRPQIIFTLHPSASRKVLMAKQNYRCAGCSMRVAPQYASKFRYCEYLGRYFCTGCHTNQLALIPGRVLQKWDFSRYPVSTFSYRLLEQMYTDPLFRVFELNKNVGKLSKNLQLCRKYRKGLHFLRDFIFTCKYAETIQERLERESSHLCSDPEVYSMEDLVNVRTGEMKLRLKELVEICCRHTSECQLCKARGFICEVCNSDDVLFPWQMRKVTRCDKCGSCYHVACWKPTETSCRKCQRIRRRKESDEDVCP